MLPLTTPVVSICLGPWASLVSNLLSDFLDHQRFAVVPTHACQKSNSLFLVTQLEAKKGHHIERIGWLTRQDVRANSEWKRIGIL